MKKFYSVLFVCAALLSACGSGPEWVVRDYIRALELEREDDLEKLYCNDAMNIDLDEVENIAADLHIDETTKNDNSAKVEISGEIAYKVDGEKESQDVDGAIYLVKQRGDWCITNDEGLIALSTNSPEGLVSSYVQELERGNEVSSFYCDSSDYFDWVPYDAEALQINDLDLRKDYSDDSYAEVEVTGEADYRYGDESYTDEIDVTFYLNWEDNAWCIEDIYEW